MKSSNHLASVVLCLFTITLISQGISCGGGGGGGSSDDDLTLSGTIVEPTAVTASVSASTRGTARQTTVGEQVASEVTCTCLTAAGESCGEFTTASDGTYTLDADPDLFTDANGIATFECDNGISGLIDVPDGTTGTYEAGTTDIDSTVALAEIAAQIPDFTGFEEGVDITGDFAVEPTCMYLIHQAMYEAASASAEGLADDTDILRETMALFMANGGEPENVGADGWVDLGVSIVSGNAESEGLWDPVVAIAGTDTADSYDGAVAATSELASFTNAQFGAEGLGNSAIEVTATAAISALMMRQEEETATEVNLCDCMKDGTCDPKAIVGPMLASDDLTAFADVFGSAAGPAVFLGTIANASTTAGNLDSFITSPATLMGMLKKEAAGGFANLYDTSTGVKTLGIGVMIGTMVSGGCTGTTLADQASCGAGMWGTFTAAGLDTVTADSYKPLGQYFQKQIDSAGGGGNLNFVTADSSTFSTAVNNVFKPILSNPAGFTDCQSTGTCSSTLPGAGTFVTACTACSTQTGTVSCGNSICEGAETATTCAADCGSSTITGPATASCGDHICSGAETPTTCNADCGGFTGGTTPGTTREPTTPAPTPSTVVLTVTVTGVATSGGVTSPAGSGGIQCGPAGTAGNVCSASFTSGTSVTLTANPYTNFTFSGWGGSCSGALPTCTLTLTALTAATSVTATFIAAVTQTSDCGGSYTLRFNGNVAAMPSSPVTLTCNSSSCTNGGIGNQGAGFSISSNSCTAGSLSMDVCTSCSQTLATSCGAGSLFTFTSCNSMGTWTLTKN